MLLLLEFTYQAPKTTKTKEVNMSSTPSVAVTTPQRTPVCKTTMMPAGKSYADALKAHLPARVRAAADSALATAATLEGASSIATAHISPFTPVLPAIYSDFPLEVQQIFYAYIKAPKRVITSHQYPMMPDNIKKYIAIMSQILKLEAKHEGLPALETLCFHSFAYFCDYNFNNLLPVLFERTSLSPECMQTELHVTGSAAKQMRDPYKSIPYSDIDMIKRISFKATLEEASIEAIRNLKKEVGEHCLNSVLQTIKNAYACYFSLDLSKEQLEQFLYKKARIIDEENCIFIYQIGPREGLTLDLCFVVDIEIFSPDGQFSSFQTGCISSSAFVCDDIKVSTQSPCITSWDNKIIEVARHNNKKLCVARPLKPATFPRLMYRLSSGEKHYSFDVLRVHMGKFLNDFSGLSQMDNLSTNLRKARETHPILLVTTLLNIQTLYSEYVHKSPTGLHSLTEMSNFLSPFMPYVNDLRALSGGESALVLSPQFFFLGLKFMLLSNFAKKQPSTIALRAPESPPASRKTTNEKPPLFLEITNHDGFSSKLLLGKNFLSDLLTFNRELFHVSERATDLKDAFNPLIACLKQLKLVPTALKFPKTNKGILTFFDRLSDKLFIDLSTILSGEYSLLQQRKLQLAQKRLLFPRVYSSTITEQFTPLSASNLPSFWGTIYTRDDQFVAKVQKVFVEELAEEAISVSKAEFEVKKGALLKYIDRLSHYFGEDLCLISLDNLKKSISIALTPDEASLNDLLQTSSYEICKLLRLSNSCPYRGYSSLSIILIWLHLPLQKEANFFKEYLSAVQHLLKFTEDENQRKTIVASFTSYLEYFALDFSDFETDLLGNSEEAKFALMQAVSSQASCSNSFIYYLLELSESELEIDNDVRLEAVRKTCYHLIEQVKLEAQFLPILRNFIRAIFINNKLRACFPLNSKESISIKLQVIALELFSEESASHKTLKAELAEEWPTVIEGELSRSELLNKSFAWAVSEMEASLNAFSEDPSSVALTARLEVASSLLRGLATQEAHLYTAEDDKRKMIELFLRLPLSLDPEQNSHRRLFEVAVNNLYELYPVIPIESRSSLVDCMLLLINSSKAQNYESLIFNKLKLLFHSTYFEEIDNKKAVSLSLKLFSFEVSKESWKRAFFLLKQIKRHVSLNACANHLFTLELPAVSSKLLRSSEKIRKQWLEFSINLINEINEDSSIEPAKKEILVRRLIDNCLLLIDKSFASQILIEHYLNRVIKVCDSSAAPFLLLVRVECFSIYAQKLSQTLDFTPESYHQIISQLRAILTNPSCSYKTLISEELLSSVKSIFHFALPQTADHPLYALELLELSKVYADMCFGRSSNVVNMQRDIQSSFLQLCTLLSNEVLLEERSYLALEAEKRTKLIDEVLLICNTLTASPPADSASLANKRVYSKILLSGIETLAKVSTKNWVACWTKCIKNMEGLFIKEDKTAALLILFEAGFSLERENAMLIIVKSYQANFHKPVFSDAEQGRLFKLWLRTLRDYGPIQQNPAIPIDRKEIFKGTLDSFFSSKACFKAIDLVLSETPEFFYGDLTIVALLCQLRSISQQAQLLPEIRERTYIAMRNLQRVLSEERHADNMTEGAKIYIHYSAFFPSSSALIAGSVSRMSPTIEECLQLLDLLNRHCNGRENLNHLYMILLRLNTFQSHRQARVFIEYNEFVGSCVEYTLSKSKHFIQSSLAQKKFRVCFPATCSAIDLYTHPVTRISLTELKKDAFAGLVSVIRMHTITSKFICQVMGSLYAFLQATPSLGDEIDFKTALLRKLATLFTQQDEIDSTPFEFNAEFLRETEEAPTLPTLSAISSNTCMLFVGFFSIHQPKPVKAREILEETLAILSEHIPKLQGLDFSEENKRILRDWEVYLALLHECANNESFIPEAELSSYLPWYLFLHLFLKQVPKLLIEARSSNHAHALSAQKALSCISTYTGPIIDLMDANYYDEGRIAKMKGRLAHLKDSIEALPTIAIHKE